LPSLKEREGADCQIYTTAEVILLEHRDYLFYREVDPATGYDELKVVHK
jgi:hypothetical protein